MSFITRFLGCFSSAAQQTHLLRSPNRPDLPHVSLLSSMAKFTSVPGGRAPTCMGESEAHKSELYADMFPNHDGFQAWVPRSVVQLQLPGSCGHRRRAQRPPAQDQGGKQLLRAFGPLMQSRHHESLTLGVVSAERVQHSKPRGSGLRARKDLARFRFCSRAFGQAF